MTITTTSNTALLRPLSGQEVPENEPADVSTLCSAPVQEVFSSIQGEGIYVGKRQLFVRFAHCHLKCAYCDTPMTSASGQCEVESQAGLGHDLFIDNPVSVDKLYNVLNTMLASTPHHSISFTGGEPLLYHRFLAELFEKLKASHPHIKTYLETSGTQADFLETVLPFTDVIAMDIKLPSSTLEAPRFDEHQAFYQRALSQPQCETFAKVVFNNHITDDEINEIKRVVTDRHTVVILQPESVLPNKKPNTTRLTEVTPATILRLESLLSQHFNDVRVIPQTHKMMQVF